MASIRLEVVGDGEGRAYVLTGISVLGRDAACAVVVPDRAVSREHAVIRPDEAGAGFVIEDLDSISGTWVNGQRTRKASLMEGDLVRLGTLELRVRSTAPPLQGEVPTHEVEMVKTRMPTTRLTLEQVRLRTGTRALGSGSAHEATALAAAPAGAPALTPQERLDLLCEVVALLGPTREPTQLAREASARVLRALPQVRRVGLFELDEAEDGDPVLRPRHLVDRSRTRDETVRVSESVLQAAVEGLRPLHCADVAGERRFASSRTLREDGVTSFVCVPLCPGERLAGVLYVDTDDATRPLEAEAVPFLVAVGTVLGAALESARLFARAQAETVRRTGLERYFSPDLAERLLRGEVPLARQGRKAQGTIMFVDIRGFTRLTTRTEPAVLVATLNAYFAAMQRIIFRGRGTVERFGGDSILAYWGVMGDDDRAPWRAARAALAMQAEIYRLNPELIAAGRPPIEVAVGLNAGEVVIGDVGSAERYEFTILGDAINMARRLEGLARPWEVLCGAPLLEALGPAALHLPLPPALVKGKDQPVAHSALYGLEVEPAPGHEGRRWELSVAGRLELPGGAAHPTLLTALDIGPAGALVEVLTAEDPEPGQPVSCHVRLPRSSRISTAAALVAGQDDGDTVLLGGGVDLTGTGLQRIRLRLPDPAPLLGTLGIA